MTDALSMREWIEAVRHDQRERIQQLDHELAGFGLFNSGTFNAHALIHEARDAWAHGDTTEVERCLALANDYLMRERRWWEAAQ